MLADDYHRRNGDVCKLIENTIPRHDSLDGTGHADTVVRQQFDETLLSQFSATWIVEKLWTKHHRHHPADYDAQT